MKDAIREGVGGKKEGGHVCSRKKVQGKETEVKSGGKEARHV